MSEHAFGVHTLIGAYVFDALGPEERALFERHRDGCARCAARVVELREAAAILGIAVADEPQLAEGGG